MSGRGVLALCSHMFHRLGTSRASARREPVALADSLQVRSKASQEQLPTRHC